jgi:hypothetical protein
MLALALLIACPEPDAPPAAPPAVDTDPPVDTDTVVLPVDDTDAPPPVEGPGYTLQSSGPILCADPTARDAQPYFQHEPSGDWQTQPFDPESDSLFVGGGLAVADFTGDGLLDVMLTSYGETFTFWIGRPDLGFDDASDRLPPLIDRTSGVTAVDVDGDLDLDAYVATFNGPSFLLQNDGAGWFTDVTEALDARGNDRDRWMSSTWADVDLDGDLDGFIASYGRLTGADGLPPGDPSALLIRQPDGTYVDLVPTFPADHPLQMAHTFLGSFNDVNDDGWPDLFMVNDFGWRESACLLVNQKGTFQRVNVGVESRLENMGLGVGDVDEDGVYDFLVTAWDNFRLYLSEPGPQWYESSAAFGLVPTDEQQVAWGAELADLDNDGDLDAWVTVGYLDVQSSHENPRAQPDGVWLQDEAGLFHDVAPAWGLDDPARNRSLVVVDLNRDGWLDAIRTDLRGPADILMARCGAASWLELELRQPGLNPFAIGARVILHTGDRARMRDVRAGGTGYGSGGPPEVHFGLGDVEVIDRVEIRWPDGEVTELTDVPTRQRLLLTREAAP